MVIALFSLWMAADRIGTVDFVYLRAEALPSSSLLRAETWFPSEIECAVTFTSCALLAIFRSIDIRKVFFLGVLCEGLALLFEGVLRFSGIAVIPEAFLLNLSLITENIGFALSMLSFFFVLITLDYRHAVFNIPLVYAVSYGFYFLSLFCPEEALFVIRILGTSVPFAILFLVLTRLGNFDISTRIKPYKTHESQDVTLIQLIRKNALVFAGVFVFTLLYRLISRFTGSKIGDNTLFGSIQSEFIILSVLVVLCFFLFFGRNRFDISLCFAGSAFFLLSAMVFLPFFDDSVMTVPWLVTRAVNFAFLILARSYVSQQTSGNERFTIVLVALLFGATKLSSPIADLFDGLLLGEDTIQFSDPFFFSICMIWLLAMVILVLFLYEKKTYARPIGNLPYTEEEPISFEEKKYLQLGEQFSLTDREREVLASYARGRSIERIASELYLSKSTVKTYLSRAYKKIDIHSRQELLDVIDQIGEATPI